MIEFIKSLFTSDPGKKIRKLRAVKYRRAMELQRNGKLREYAAVMKEIELLEEQYFQISVEHTDNYKSNNEN